jgi:hypothetical protein
VPSFTLPRFAYGLLALILVVAIAYLVVIRGVSGWHVLAFALAPDVSFLFGMAPGLARGQIHPRVVALYNALHSVPGPIVLGAAAIVWLGLPWLAGALAWAAHIAVDRSLGIGLRTREGFIRD